MATLGIPECSAWRKTRIDPGEAFLEQLATYALRRVMTVDDVEQLRATAESTSDGDYGVQSLVRGLVMSDLFRKR